MKMKIVKSNYKVCEICGSIMSKNGNDRIYQYLKCMFPDRDISCYSCSVCNNYVCEIKP